MLKGLLLGAGASRDFGLPLVKDLTDELHRRLPREDILMLQGVARLRGDGYPDEILEEFLQAMAAEKRNYERVIGYFQTKDLEARDPRGIGHTYHSIALLISRVVLEILIDKHIENSAKFCSPPAEYIGGILSLAVKNRPLWIFSLNYDLVIESLACASTLDCDCGLTIRESRRFFCQRANDFHELSFDRLNSEDISEFGLIFRNDSAGGINLVKLHGSLDLFTVNNGKDLLKLRPSLRFKGSQLMAFRELRTEMIRTRPFHPNGPLPSIEYVYEDANRAPQFLQQTPIVGTLKHDYRYQQILPYKILDVLEKNLGRLHVLVSIGYSFGDNHINKSVLRWLQSEKGRRLEIVSPRIEAVPAIFAEVEEQVSINPTTAVEFFKNC
jgi:hypothetical protein